MYTGVLEVLSSYYYSFIQTLSNVFENVSQVSTCGMSCQRQAQLLCSKQLDSSQNITFGEQTSAKKSESRMKFMKSILQRQKSNCTGERMETIEDNDNLRNRENDSISNIIESPGSSAHRKQCSKCIEQGFTYVRCPILCIVKATLFVLVAIFVLYLPLGDPEVHCATRHNSKDQRLAMCCLCDLYMMAVKLCHKLLELIEFFISIFVDLLYEAKLRFYTFLEKIDGKDLCRSVCCFDLVNAKVAKDDVDKVIEDEITQKLSNDLVQSIERKFQVDLERSVDMVLIKIRLLLQNGTQHIQSKLIELQTMMDIIKSHGEEEVNKCLSEKQNVTTALAEKALHQMVVCGYALIGQDPSQAVRNVLGLKTMIKERVKPINEQKSEIYGLLKVCGHEHDSLKKVVKCVISKSPVIKSTMMEITGKLIEGVVDLTKQMAHGAMHEACLIEVVKAIETEAMDIVKDIQDCAYKNLTFIEVNNFIAENNATVLDVEKHNKTANETNVKDVQDLLRRMLEKDSATNFDNLKVKLKELHKDLNNIDNNLILNDVDNKDV
ncbi:unnamed protein product [Colias eurytheme]|nr:unnamed protein product [Colias eurytheme]